MTELALANLRAEQKSAPKVQSSQVKVRSSHRPLAGWPCQPARGSSDTHEDTAAPAVVDVRVTGESDHEAPQQVVPGGSVRGKRANFTLVLDCVEADFDTLLSK